MDHFKLHSKYQPTGDQPHAIEELVKGFEEGNQFQTLLGVTGSGKTFTMANVIQALNKPTLIISHNKTLAAQLYGEMKEFFPENAVEYFVSYYDYYQPEAYVPQTDTYIAKDSAINEEIDKLRLSATAALVERKDVIVVASVSCIYGLGSPEDYLGMMVSLRPGMEKDRDDVIRALVDIQYTRNDMDFHRGTFRVRGDTVEIFPANYSDTAIRVEFFGDEIDGIRIFDPESQRSVENVEEVQLKAVSDLLLQEEDFIRGQKQIEQLQEQSANEEFKSYLAEILGDISQRKLHPDLRKFISFFYEKQYTLFDYLPKHTPVFLDDYQKIADQIARFELDTANLLTEDLHKNRASSRQVYFADTSTTLRKYTPAAYFSNFQKGLGNLKFDHLYQFNQYPMQEFFGQFDLLKEEIERYRKSNYTVIVQATSHHNLQQLHKNLEEYGIRLDYIDGDTIIPQASQLVVGLSLIHI